VEIAVNYIRFGSREINCAIAHNITERKQAEEALKLSESRYRQMFETNMAVMLIIDPSDGRIIDANEAAHRFYGYDAQTLTSMRIMDINTLPDKEIWQEMELAKMEERNFFNFHHRLASGNIREVEVYSGPVQIGSKTLLYSIIHDITGRVNLEKINRVMFRIAKSTSTTQTLPELVNSIRTYLNEVIDTTNFYIGLYDESTDTISEPYSADEYDSFTTFPAAKTLTAYVIKTGKPLFADDKTYDELHQAGQVDILGTPSELWLGVPLKVKDIVIGALAVQSYTDANLYTEKDLELLAHVSHEIATVIERKQAEEELYKKTIIQEKLLETASQLSASLDLTEVLDRIAHQAHGLLDAYGCVLYELDEEGKTLTPMIAVEPGDTEAILSVKLDIDSCLTGEAIKAKHSMIFNYANKHPNVYQIPGTPIEKDEHVLVSPFIVNNTVIGAMLLNRVGRIFTKDNLLLAEGFANYAAIALKNASTYHDLLDEIAERKKVEGALRDSEQKYRLLATNTLETIWTTDIEFNLTYINDAVFSFLGYTPEEFLGLNPSVFTPPEGMQAIQNAAEHLIAKYKRGKLSQIKFDLQQYRKDGTLIDVEITCNLLIDSAGKIAGFQGRSIDVSERKQAEEAVKESEVLLRQVIDTSPNCIYVKDREGRYVLINKVMADLHHTTPEALIGTKDIDLTEKWLNSPQKIKDFRAAELEVINKKQIRFIPEEEFTYLDGTKRWFQTTKSPIMLKDKQEYLMGVAMDITASKQMEDQLRHAQKLESITKLTGGIAHDFNNILGAIFGSIDMILLQLPQDHPSRRFADIILDQSQKAANLVKQMLAYSRQQRLDPGLMNINKVVEDLSMLLDRALEERIELKLQLADDLKPIYGDKTAIDQIMMNLCLNATDAMKAGGKLTVKTENLENVDKYIEDHPSVKHRRYVLISVIDTGHGIKPEDLKQIFEPFFTTREVGEGTGLGLSMVYGLVKQHDGYVFCQSEVGHGTTFELLLPVINKLQTASEKTSTDDLFHHGSGKIMVVEDEQDLVEILDVMLTELGYDVITATDGEKALVTYREVGKQVDMVISDIIMPRMGGKELYEKLKKINPGVKFVFTSGYASQGFYKKFDIDPEMRVLGKPFRLKDVSDMVKEVLNHG